MDDLFSLKGKNVVVVGGAGGIGRGLAQGFVRYGAQVAIADINVDQPGKRGPEIEAATGQNVRTYPVDTGPGEQRPGAGGEDGGRHGARPRARQRPGLQRQGPGHRVPGGRLGQALRRERPRSDAVLQELRRSHGRAGRAARSSTFRPSGGRGRLWAATSPTAPARALWT